MKKTQHISYGNTVATGDCNIKNAKLLIVLPNKYYVLLPLDHLRVKNEFGHTNQPARYTCCTDS